MSEVIQWSNNTCRLNKINGQFGKDIYAQLFVDQIGRDFKGRILSIGLREAFGISKINTLLPDSTIDVIDIFPAESWAIPNKVFKTHITQIATLQLKYESEEELKDDIFTILKNIDMTQYDKIIMNPPFKLGNKICSEVLKHCKGDVICLMPLSKYKAGKLYEHIDLSTFKLVDPRLFSEVTITNNLSIATLKHETQFEDFGPLVDLSYDPRYVKVYEFNRENIKYTCTGVSSTYTELKRAGLNQSSWVEITARTAQNGVHKTENCHDYHWNVLKDIPENDLAGNGQDANKSVGAYFLRLRTVNEKINYCKWWYSAGLSDKLVRGLNNQNGSIFAAIPQIDWDKISEDEDWKKGDYDKAVLNAMGLEMREDRVVAKGLNQCSDFRVLEELSFNPRSVKVYTYNRKNLGTYVNYQSIHNKLSTLQAAGLNQDTWFEATMRTVQNGVHKTENCHDYHWNVLKDIPVTDVPIDSAYNTCSSGFYTFTSKVAKDNFCKWWYSARLSDRLIRDLNKVSGSIEIAIPQIDWDKVSEDEDWKTDPDKAVLKAMGMYMDTDGYIKEIEK